jgi:hypothetical protein
MPKVPPKYYPLQRYLEAMADAEVTLSFAELEVIIGGPLPQTALLRSWWANRRTQPQGRAWLTAGWQTSTVQTRQRRVTFVRRVAG